MSRQESRWTRLAADTKRSMVEEINAFEEKLKRDNEALDAAKKAEAARNADTAKENEVAKRTEAAPRAEAAKEAVRPPPKVCKPFNPFEGAPLPKIFPKTPQNFHKGERVFALDKKNEEESTPSPILYNPFEGVPLSPNFPKTPLNFWRGHVVGEPTIMVTDHDAEVGDGELGRIEKKRNE